MFFIGLETASIPMAAFGCLRQIPPSLCRGRCQIYSHGTVLQRIAAIRIIFDLRYGRHSLLCRHTGTPHRRPVADYGIRILLLRHGIQNITGAFPSLDSRRLRRRSKYGNRLFKRYLQRLCRFRADDYPHQGIRPDGSSMARSALLIIIRLYHACQSLRLAFSRT